jgi:hypothetical protein
MVERIPLTVPLNWLGLLPKPASRTAKTGRNTTIRSAKIEFCTERTVVHVLSLMRGWPDVR